MSDWLMRRNCALTPAQTVASYAAASALVLGVAAMFVALGHWPVLPFALIELLLMGAILLRYCRHARDFERISVQDGVLRVQVRDGERTVEWQAMAALVRFEPCAPCGLVVLRYGGKTIEVGRHLPWPQRPAFAERLRRACGSNSVAAATEDSFEHRYR